MPRAIWTGAISFGLVNVPVRMYPAVETSDLEFDLVHVTDGGRIGYRKYCKLEEKLVPDEEIAKGYPVGRDSYVYLDDEDFAAAETKGHHTIEVLDFVPYDEIDPIYFERTSYLGPQDGSEHVYALLLRAMEKSGLVGIARYVLREREHLGCLRPRDGVITLEKMYFADEIRPVKEIAPAKVRVSAKELELAVELVGRFAGSWNPDKYEDTYRSRLLEVIEAKKKGEEIHVEPAGTPEAPGDLVEALRASLEAAKRGGNGKGGRSTASRRSGAKTRRSGAKTRRNGAKSRRNGGKKRSGSRAKASQKR